ncbi:MAG: pyridoxal phosphate-dependent aminotransferase [Tissierellia bacterium]|nr:pyridoxal phosphate-dependent aminotransferase [Tissierellia bacterium]
MRYNFDEVVNRNNTDSRKWGTLEEIYGTTDILPMWVADMDFKSADEIIEALKKRAEHGVFGYTWEQDSFYDSIIKWVKRRHNWNIKKEWILFTPGVVMGLNLGVRELVKEGEKVLIQSPVYPPFYRVIENNNRIVNLNPLKDTGEKFVMDYEDLEQKIDKDTKLMMICNPHNPVGRVWTREELIRLGDICIKNEIVIISDEIHSDFILKGHTHVPLASISKELEERTITLMAPSKTFNIAGLATSVAIIPNEELRNAYEKAIEVMEIGNTTIFGNVGFEAAYNHGEEWLDELLIYIEDNIDYAMEYINRNIPEIKVYRPDGTYLLWLNFRGLNKSPEEINEALIKIGKVGLNEGSPYGKEGEGFFRLNIGCARSILEEGLRRIEKAVKSL